MIKLCADVERIRDAIDPGSPMPRGELIAALRAAFHAPTREGLHAFPARHAVILDYANPEEQPPTTLADRWRGQWCINGEDATTDAVWELVTPQCRIHFGPKTPKP